MLTAEQEKWIAHLSDEDRISIIPFDTTSEEKFEGVRQKIQYALGTTVPVEHRGATSLGISGQDEIDVYIPVPPASFDFLTNSLKGLFGEPRSLYPLDRARFVTVQDGKHIDIFLINREHKNWRNMVMFEEYLRSHPVILEAYKKLKEDGNGLSVQEYYRRKIEFINNVLSKTGNIEVIF